MIKLAVTGLISSGKTTATNIISELGIPKFCADQTVKNIYLHNLNFKRKLFKLAPQLKNKKFLKKETTKITYKNQSFLKELEKIIHPLVREKMIKFIYINNRYKKKIIVLDIPLLIENKLQKYFDKIILINCSRNLRKKRFTKKVKNKTFFDMIDKKQLSFKEKKKYCDYVINNSSSIKDIKKKVIKLINNIKNND